MKRYGSIDEALDVNDDLLTTDEEQLLLTIIKEKGVECKEMDKLLRANMRFIVSLANQYKSKGVDFTDLIWIVQDALPFNYPDIHYLKSDEQEEEGDL